MIMFEIADKRVHKGYGSSSVYIVVSVDEHFLLAGDGLFESLHGFVHVFHQKRIVEFGKVRLEEFPGSVSCGYVALYQ